MSNKLLEILKSNSNDIKLIKEQLTEINTKINKLELEVAVNNNDLKEISNKSFYIESYLESIQDSEIKELLEQEEQISISNENNEE